MRLNIILILIDDLGWRDLGCFGSSFYETPNLDRLAAEGMRFTNSYAACPVCSPTRAAILTGKYPARLGMTNWIGGNLSGRLADVPYLHYLPLEETSIAAALRQEGYATWHVGKWHLGDNPFWPEQHGFDVNIGGSHHGAPPGPNGFFSPYHLPTLPDGPAGEYLTDRLTSEAIGLIENRDPGRPFLLNLCHYAVHVPIQAPEELVQKYRQKARDLGLDESDAVEIGEEFRTLTPPGLTPMRIQRRRIQSHAVYAAMVENLDTNVGRLLASLDAQGIANNTMVVFTSDNGGLATSGMYEGSPTCNLPLAEGKGWAQEGGTRVCQIVRWPGVVRPGSVCGDATISTDFYPTFLAAAGAAARPDQHADGVNLFPLLSESGPIDREAIYWHYPHYSPQGGTPASWIVSGRWKLVEYFEDGRRELFDLVVDQSETHNLAEAHPPIAARLAAMLANWRIKMEAQIPQRNPQWEQWARKRITPRVANNAHV